MGFEFVFSSVCWSSGFVALLELDGFLAAKTVRQSAQNVLTHR